MDYSLLQAHFDTLLLYSSYPFVQYYLFVLRSSYFNI